MVCYRVQPGTPAISYKLITTQDFIHTPRLPKPLLGRRDFIPYPHPARQCGVTSHSGAPGGRRRPRGPGQAGPALPMLWERTVTVFSETAGRVGSRGSRSEIDGPDHTDIAGPSGVSEGEKSGLEWKRRFPGTQPPRSYS